MKGLLVKDYRILFTQMKTLIFILCIGVVMMLSMDSADFIVGYMLMMVMILSIGTINYDELDNGMAFLMTMPAPRKGYVMEKYLFTFFNTVGGMIAMFVLYLLTKGFFSWGLNLVEMISNLAGWLFGIMLAASLMIPLYLKFPAEKRRLIMFILYGVIFIGIYSVKSIYVALQSGVGEEVSAVIGKFIMFIEEMNPVVFCLLILALIVFMVCVSAYISIKIMQKKEF